MALAKPVSYPPRGEWDRRLTAVACPGLEPVATLHENPWFFVRERGGYYTTEFRLRQVAVLPVVDDAGIVMVRVRRPVMDDTMLELPAGAIEAGEEAAAGAAREFAEETGIAISDVRRFAPMPPLSAMPNRVPNLLYVFRIDLTADEFARRAAHDAEVESVHCISLDEAAGLILGGGIYAALPVAVIATFLLGRTPRAAFGAR